jgi:hypothetical protein
VTRTRTLALVTSDMPLSMSTTGPDLVVSHYRQAPAGHSTQAVAVVSATTPDAGIKVYHDF